MSNRVWTLPNVLTFVRLALVPVTVLLIVKNRMLWALASFLLACATDLLDGWIARRFHLTTRLGVWLDPLADKLMAVCVLITFTWVPARIIPLWVTVTVFAKELLLLAGGLVILRRGKVTPSNRFGKLAALALNISIGSGFLYEYWSPWYLYAVYAATGLVVAAFVQYAIANGHLLFETGKTKSVEEE